jgi:hypothetical protein
MVAAVTVPEILAVCERRDVHVRQYLSPRRYELWADSQRHSTHRRPIDAESAIRSLLGITNAEGVAIEEVLDREENRS